MTTYEKTFAEISDMNPTHLETLAIEIHYTLNSLTLEDFKEVARMGEQMGAEALAEYHNAMVC